MRGLVRAEGGWIRVERTVCDMERNIRIHGYCNSCLPAAELSDVAEYWVTVGVAGGGNVIA